jgi:hypothetical protein
MQHYSRFDNSLSNGLVDDSNSSLLLNPSDNRQTNLWNKPNKLTRSTSLFTGICFSPQNLHLKDSILKISPSFLIDMSYGNESGQMVNNLNSQQPQQQFCYSNCYVVNIDGPINFNAIHSLQDDGSDLPFSDINTIRFFYNLGIEVFICKFKFSKRKKNKSFNLLRLSLTATAKRQLIRLRATRLVQLVTRKLD